MSEPRCGTCTFYRPPDKAAGPGECRRRSPIAHHDAKTGACRAFWPWVWGERDWCGDYREDVLEHVEVASMTLCEGTER